MCACSPSLAPIDQAPRARAPCISTFRPQWSSSDVPAACLREVRQRVPQHPGHQLIAALAAPLLQSFCSTDGGPHAAWPPDRQLCVEQRRNAGPGSAAACAGGRQVAAQLGGHTPSMSHASVTVARTASSRIVRPEGVVHFRLLRHESEFVRHESGFDPTNSGGTQQRPGTSRVRWSKLPAANGPGST